MELTSVDMAKEEGYSAALSGEFRAIPCGKYKLLSDEHKAWYEGFDTATTGNHNPVLTSKFRQRA